MAHLVGWSLRAVVVGRRGVLEGVMNLSQGTLTMLHESLNRRTGDLFLEGREERRLKPICMLKRREAGGTQQNPQS